MEITLIRWQISIHWAALAPRALQTTDLRERAANQARRFQQAEQRRDQVRTAYLLQGGR